MSNKNTYLMIKLLEEANQDDLLIIEKWRNIKNRSEEKINVLTELLKKYEIDSKSEKLTKEYFSKGMEILKNIPSNKNQMNYLKTFFENLLVRKY